MADLARGDWAEDAAHENGNYQNRCCLCDRLFIGHKRRVVCRACHDEARDLRAEVERLRKAVDEREGDMHLRIRADYDTTVADLWRAAVAKEQAEVERLRGLLAALDEKVSAVMPSMPLEKFAAHFDMECSRVRWQRVLEVLERARKEVGRG